MRLSENPSMEESLSAYDVLYFPLKEIQEDLSAFFKEAKQYLVEKMGTAFTTTKESAALSSEAVEAEFMWQGSVLVMLSILTKHEAGLPINGTEELFLEETKTSEFMKNAYAYAETVKQASQVSENKLNELEEGDPERNEKVKLVNRTVDLMMVKTSLLVSDKVMENLDFSSLPEKYLKKCRAWINKIETTVLSDPIFDQIKSTIIKSVVGNFHNVAVSKMTEEDKTESVRLIAKSVMKDYKDVLNNKIYLELVNTYLANSFASFLTTKNNDFENAVNSDATVARVDHILKAEAAGINISI